MDQKDILKGHVDAVEAKLEGFESEQKAFRAIIDEIQQKQARSGGGRYTGASHKTLGMAAVEGNESAIAGLAKERGRLSLDVKAIITSLTTDANGSAGDLLVPTRDTLVQLPRRRFLVRDLLNVLKVSGNLVQIPKQTGRTINAATVLEGAEKPSSELKFDLKDVPIRTIAHWVLASKQILEDAPQLMGIIDGELRYGLMLIEELQLLLGTGTGSDLTGLTTDATAFAPALTVEDPTMLDVIGLAILQNGLADFPADGIVVHPSDWMKMRLLKNGDGDYIMGPPAADVEPRLFGLPVAVTPAQPLDKFMVGNFEAAATLYDRWEPRVEVSTEDSDNFRKNLVTVLAEERIGLGIKNPLALTKGDFSDAITAATAP